MFDGRVWSAVVGVSLRALSATSEGFKSPLQGEGMCVRVQAL